MRFALKRGFNQILATEADELIGVIDFHAVADEYSGRFAGCCMAALINEFGEPVTAPVDPDDLGEIFGIKIPPLFADRAKLLHDSVGLDAKERSPAMNTAVSDFIAYCDAAEIALPRKPPPTEDDLVPAEPED